MRLIGNFQIMMKTFRICTRHEILTVPRCELIYLLTLLLKTLTRACTKNYRSGAKKTSLMPSE